jgi:alkylation response protein AidB-like acyl-CoA dehydrogenase
MDIQFTEEQELLRSSVQRLLRDQYDFDARRKIVATEQGFSRQHWALFAELGLLAAPFSEDAGGLGGGPLSTMIVMQEFGRHLVAEPFLETVVLAGQTEAFIPDIIAGKAIWALAWTEKGSRYDVANVATTARREGGEYILNGEKTAVIGAPWADYLIVSARISGNRQDRNGVSLFVVDRRAANLDLQSFRTSMAAAPRRSACATCAWAPTGCSEPRAKASPRWRRAATAPSPRSVPRRSARWAS